MTIRTLEIKLKSIEVKFNPASTILQEELDTINKIIAPYIADTNKNKIDQTVDI